MKSLVKCKCGFSNHGEAFPKGLVCKIHNFSKLVCFHCKQKVDNPGDLNQIGWGIMEFGDGWFPMCSQCKLMFEPENIMIHGWEANLPNTTYRGYKNSKWFKERVYPY